MSPETAIIILSLAIQIKFNAPDIPTILDISTFQFGHFSQGDQELRPLAIVFLLPY